jgi:hypothetical protein
MFDSFMYKVSLVCWNQLVDSGDAASELEEMEQEPATANEDVDNDDKLQTLTRKKTNR